MPRRTIAREAFSVMLRDHIAPALREMGFTGSGQTFMLHTPHHYAQLGFQKSHYYDVRFTINVSVVSSGKWEDARRADPKLPVRPAANSMYYNDLTWFTRIGRLMPGGLDQWWHVSEGESTDGTAAEVVAAIREWALPAIRHQVDTTSRG